jgi:multidrug transporter EmrE-like cation transporter
MRRPQPTVSSGAGGENRPDNRRAGPIRQTGGKVSLHWAALAAAIAISLVAQTLLKSAAGSTSFITQLFDFRTFFGLGSYAASAVFYIIALRKIPMSVALPSTAVSYVAAALIGHYAFGEVMTLARVGGIGLICCGVLVLTLG